MKITEVTVSYGETQTLSGHCNVKSSITLTATVEEGESPYEVTQALLINAKEMVHQEVDQALENDGQSPRYYTGPLYNVLISQSRQVICIAPANLNAPVDFRSAWGSGANLRLHRAQARAQGISGFQVVDCSDGDFSKLPPLPEQVDDKFSTVSRAWVNRFAGRDSDDDGDEEQEEEVEPNL